MFLVLLGSAHVSPRVQTMVE